MLVQATLDKMTQMKLTAMAEAFRRHLATPEWAELSCRSAPAAALVCLPASPPRPPSPFRPRRGRGTSRPLALRLRLNSR